MMLAPNAEAIVRTVLNAVRQIRATVAATMRVVADEMERPDRIVPMNERLSRGRDKSNVKPIRPFPRRFP